VQTLTHKALARNTWANIVNNKRNLLWCTKHFEYLGNRETCIDQLAGGLLAKDPHAAQAILAQQLGEYL